MTTLELIKKNIFQNTEIKSIRFHKFPIQYLLQNKIEFDENEVKQFEKAILIRDCYNLPFWDSMMLTYFNNSDTSYRILELAISHNKQKDIINISNIEQLKDNIKITRNESIAFNSRVILKDGSIKHFPLLDFHIPINENNFQQVIKVLKTLGLNGYIVNSGESYHFIGDELLNIEELLDFLARSLFFAPIIDRAWIAHQILERSCSLRIGLKHGVEPQVIYKLQNI